MSDYPSIRKAVFPVTGLGSRFLPATKSIPKEMLAIVDKPLVQYAVKEAVEAGIETLICGSRQGFIRATVDYVLEHEELRDDLLSYFETFKVPSRQ